MMTGEQILGLQKEKDLSIRLIFYIRDTDSKDLCQDVFFILDSIIKSPEELKDYYTSEFITRLFDILDLIEDDLNYKAVIKILVQINAFFTFGVPLPDPIIHRNKNTFGEFFHAYHKHTKTQK